MSDITFHQEFGPQVGMIAAQLRSRGSTDIAVFGSNTNCAVIRSIDPTPKHGKLLHCSISHPTRYPTWDEIKAMKESFFGDVDAMMVLPRQELYVNLHPRTFHLWTMPEAWDLM